MRRGFTVVELVITISIMAILLTLAVVNLLNTQASSRDAERKADIESIQMYLEDYYRNNNSGGEQNVYPSTIIGGAPLTTLRQYFPDVDEKIFIAPGFNSPEQTFKAAASGSDLDNSFLVLDGGSYREPNTNEYIYQPLDKDGELCVPASPTGCRKYNLFYRQETDNTLQTINSKNQ